MEFYHLCVNMERRKAEAQCQLKKLKEECQITVGLLNKLIDVCSNHVIDLEKLDSRDFRLHSKYFLAVSQFQYLSHQKLLELNVDLEEHLFERDPPNLQHFKLVNCTATSPTITVARESECSLLSPTTSLANEPLQLKQAEINNQSNKITDILLDLKIESNERSQSSSNSQNNNQILYENNVRDTVNTITSLSRQNSTCEQNLNVNNDCDTKETMSQKAVSTSTLLETKLVNSINKNTTNEDDGSTSSEYFCSSSNLNETRSQNGMEATKSDESFYSQVSFEADFPQLESFEADFPQLESSPNKVKEPEPAKSSKIIDQLKSLPSMSLEEKFMKHLPKAPMPDLSLRPIQKKTGGVASNVSDNNLCSKREKKKEKIVQKPTVERPLQRVEIVEIYDRVPPKLGDICMIGYMESPSHFYIQVADENIELIDLWPIQLESIFGNSAPPYFSKTEAMNKMGNFCCVKCDNFWYRAQVLDWMPTETPDEEEVLVQLIDYGNTYVCNYTELRPLLRDFCHLPKMAQLCHLAYLHPPGSTKGIRRREWPEESLTGFYNMCGNLDSNIFKITHVYKGEERNSFELDLVRSDYQDEEKSIGQMLIESGFAVQILDDMPEVRNHNMTKQIRAAHGLEGIQPNMSEEEIWDKYFEQNVDFEPMSVSEKIMHYNPRDEAETCKNLRPDGTCYKGTRCKLRHTPLKHGFTRDREDVYERTFADAPLLNADDEVELTISHIVDIQCFYAQLRQRDELVSAGLTINRLIKEMNNENTVKNYEELKYPPTKGQLVIAKHWNDFWYRAQVRGVSIPQNNAETLVEVYFVDFGDKLEVCMSNLRVILPDFLNIPFQATECRFFNVRHKDGIDEAEERRHFESRYLGQNFRAKIVAIPGHLVVLLKNDKDEDVGLKLIEDGYGELNTEHNFPADNEMVLID